MEETVSVGWTSIVKDAAGFNDLKVIEIEAKRQEG